MSESITFFSRETMEIKLGTQLDLTRKLQSGERVIWEGKPIPRFFTSRTIPKFRSWLWFFAFIILWINFTTWIVSKNNPEDDSGEGFDPLFVGIPFILISLLGLTGPLWGHHFSKQTRYVLTNRRAILILPGWIARTVSLTPAELSQVTCRLNPDGSGDVVLHHHEWTTLDDENVSTEYAFWDVPAALEVEAAVKRLATCETVSQTNEPQVS